MFTILRATAAVACFAVAHAQEVLIVHPVLGPFTTVQAAVDVADPGDLVLIDAPVVSVELVIDRGVTIASSVGGLAQFEKGIHVRNLPAGQTVVLSGVSSSGIANSDDPRQGYGLEIQDCAGDVRVQDSDFFGADGDAQGWIVDFIYGFEVTGHPTGWPGIRATDNTGSVTFTNVTSIGGDATSTETWISIFVCGCTVGPRGGAGALIGGADAAFDRCTLVGGRGGNGDQTGGIGGQGLAIYEGVATVAGSTLQGGEAGDQTDAAINGLGGVGGSGIQMSPTFNGVADVYTLDTAVSAGESGAGFFAPGDEAMPIVGFSYGTVTASSNTHRELNATAFAFDDEDVAIDVAGEPGDTVLLFIAPSGASFIPSTKFSGAFSVAFPALSVQFGVIPASGELSLVASAPPLAPISAVTVHLQALAGNGDDVTLTGHRTLALVDAAFD